MSQRTTRSRPQPSKGPAKGPTSRRRRWAKRILLTVVGLGVLGVLGFAVAYATTSVPNPNAMATAQATIVYYADGKTEMARLNGADGNRESVPLSKVPVDVQHAFLAAEDRTFYENRGISPRGIARALRAAVTGGETQGGSTITQQYVKNYFLTQDQTVTRKVREIMISLKIDRQLSKDQILENYLNTIYFGRGASGIQTAAQAYFGKDVSRLTASEGALLASVIRGPSFYDPALGQSQLDLARSRWTYVADGMATKGWITSAQREAMRFPANYKPKKVVGSGTTGYVTDAVKRELLGKLGLTDAEIERGGLRIVTTIDKAKQDAAVRAVKDKMPTGVKDLHAGLASVVPGDGAVVALYGGSDFQKAPFNTATQATIQAGSTFKIFTLMAALASDVSTSTRYDGHSPQYFDQFKDAGNPDSFHRQGGVTNFDNEQFGRIDVRTATAHSVNTVYAQLNIAATPQKTTEMARTAGVTTKMTSNYANVFGTDDVRVLDMANAYATIAANGKRATPYFVKKVTSVANSFTFTAKPEVKPVFDAALTSDVIDCMTQVIENGTGRYAQALGRPAAGKTGTTEDNYGAWFDGFTPQLATAVGIYKGDGSIKKANSMNDIPGVGQLTGGTVPVQVWTEYMVDALKGTKVIPFPEPAHINQDKVVVPTTAPPVTTTAPPTTTTTAPPTTTTTAPPTTTTTVTAPPTRTTTTTVPTVTVPTIPSVTVTHKGSPTAKATAPAGAAAP